jgi:hypothetical protein
MNLWWFPKHDPTTAAAIGQLDSDIARVLLAVRPAIDALASSAVYQGWCDEAWVLEQVQLWRSMLAVARLRSVTTVMFEHLRSSRPHDIAAAIAESAGIAMDSPTVGRDWASLYAEGVQDGLVGSAERSNLPDSRRNGRLIAARRKVVALLGVTLVDELEGEYRSIRALALDGGPGERR